MRLSFDGRYALAKHVMHRDPLSGNLFAFINRRATQIHVLYLDRSGLCVWAKRLEQGRLVSLGAKVYPIPEAAPLIPQNRSIP